MNLTERNIEHARWLAKLGSRGVHQHWQSRSSSRLPDPFAALDGLAALLQAGEHNRETLRRIVLGLWAQLAPHPTPAVPPEAWRILFQLIGPSIDEDEWKRRTSLVLFRGCGDEEAARSGWSWTTEPAVARCHAEGRTGSSVRKHASLRIFTTTAPREACWPASTATARPRSWSIPRGSAR
jgi:hypothetical protein